jgi:hypothetical protein
MNAMDDHLEDLKQGFLDWLTRWATDYPEGPGEERPALVEVGEAWVPFTEVFAQLRYCADPLPAAAVALVRAVLGEGEEDSPRSYGEAVEALSSDGQW